MSLEEIVSKINSKIIKNVFIPTYRYINKDNDLYILLLYKKNTYLNPYKETDIFFSITINNSFPKIIPYVRCISNFHTPTLYDNRNYFYSILHYNNENNNINSLNIETIFELFNKIPKFLNFIKNSKENKILSYFGTYLINEIYDVNDFISNPMIFFFRIYMSYKNKKDFKKFKRYLILTEIYFILIEPAPDCLNLGKLLFFGDINYIKQRKIDTFDKDHSIVYLKIDEKITLEFIMENNTYNEFIKKGTEHIKTLNNEFDVYEDENFNDNSFRNVIQNFDKNRLKKEIENKEEIFKYEKNIYFYKELTILYEKLLENNNEYNEQFKNLKKNYENFNFKENNFEKKMKISKSILNI